MLNLKKKENEFFIYLKEFAEMIVVAGEEFKDLVNNYDSANIKEKVARIKELEIECDAQAHKILVAVNASFITPFDREDFHAIVKEMDDIIDSLEQVASRFVVFDIQALNEECCEMTSLIDRAIKEVNVLFQHLSEVKKNNKVKEQIIEINRLENDGDIVYRAALTKLFKEEKDPIELIKWKHLYEHMEECLDSCESVANIIEGIVMKYV